MKEINQKTHTRPHVSVIILQYNNSGDVIKAAESVKEQNWSEFDIVIVDNASGKEHLNSIRLFIENQRKTGISPNYTLLINDDNLGYAGGNNAGIKHALDMGAQYLLILNPDVILEKNTLSILVEAAESDRRIGILGPVIDEGSDNVICGGEIEWYSPELRHIKCSDPLNLEPQASDPKFYIVGACMLVAKSVFQLVGFFDERYFLYFEDADFCLRSKRANWKLKVISGAIAHHAPSSSTRMLGSSLLLRYHYRNSHLFVLKNELCLCKFIFLPLWSTWIIIKQFLKIVLTPKKREISRAILAGVMDFYTAKFGKINA